MMKRTDYFVRIAALLLALLLLTGCGAKKADLDLSDGGDLSAAAGTNEPVQVSYTNEEDAATRSAPDAELSAGGQQTETVSLAEGTSFRWRDYGGSVVKTGTGGISSGMFVLKPADMTEDEYCFNLYLNVDSELLDNEDLKGAFYEASLLVDAQGNQYSPSVSARPSEGADLLFLYAIPNGVAADELQLAFSE